MNTTTRELIERELEEAEADHRAICHSIEARKATIRRDEERRDELANKIGALKEDLGHKEVSTTLRVEADGFQRAMRKFTSQVTCSDPDRIAEVVAERLRRSTTLRD